MKKFAFVILLLIPLISFGQAEKRYRSIIVDSLKALNGGRVDVKDTLLLDSLAVYNTDLSLQYTSRSLVDSAFIKTAISASGGNTIYSADDNLAGNRTVTMGGFGLTFDGNQTTFKGINAAGTSDVAVFRDNVLTDLVTIQNNGGVLIGTSTQIFGGKLTIETAGVGITVKATDATANYYLGQNSAGADIHNMRITSGVGIYDIASGPRFGGDFSVMPNLALGGSTAADGAFTLETRGAILMRKGLPVIDNGTQDSPILQKSGKYDADPTAGLNETDFDAEIQVIMTSAGVSPVGRLSFKVEGNEGLSINQDGDVTINNALATTGKLTTLGVAATTFVISGNVLTLTGDGGGNTIATITGALSGQYLILIFVDNKITITDDNGHGANTIDLSAAFTSDDDTVLQLIYDGTSFYEVSRSVN